MNKSEATESTDLDRLALLRKGDQRAYSQVYQDYYPMVAKMVHDNSGSHDDAEDLYQETMVCLLKKVNDPDFNLTSKLSTFLYSIARNLWLQKLAKSGKSKVVAGDVEDLRWIAVPQEEPWQSEWEANLQIVTQKLEELKEDCMQILKYSFYERKSQIEIAELMGYEVDFVKVKKFRCLEYLRKAVKATIQSNP